MRLVKPSFEIWSNDMPLLEKIEKAGRVAYQSNEEGDPEKFVRKIIKKGHESVLEHGWIGVHEGYVPSHLRKSQALCGYKQEMDVLWGNIRFWRNLLKLENYIGSKLYSVVNDLKAVEPVLFEDIPRFDGRGYSYPIIRNDPPVATVNFIVDRGVSHELVRHRIASFTMESTRYCTYKDHVTFVIPPWIDVQVGWYTHDEYKTKAICCKPDDDIWARSLLYAERSYADLLSRKWSPQQARSVLPNSLKTQIVTTATWDEWQLIFALRTYPDAHPQMQEVMIPLKQEFQKQFPLEWFSDEAIDNRRNELLNRIKS